ncbi:A-kinase anchor protein 9 isoform X2 [Ranitomeya imitator]|uniref:A-kinase anchor protein 9 isoform X2 n=1 Tax=Ranitomeya imitator TaxID=111125 RepID=UPI0037E7C7D4
MDGEEQERKRKLEAGKAKLAQFRQRKGQTDGQNPAKKNKKKKPSSSSKQDGGHVGSEAGLSQRDDVLPQTGPSRAGTTAEFTIMRTLPQGEMIQHDKTYTIEPESEVSTTADDYSSEVVDDGFPLPASDTAHILWEEEFGVRETFSERGTRSSLARLEVMEDELAGKQQEIDELNRELEEMRAAYGTEGLQQLQEFETAIKQRDGIITQLTANLQQARKEKDDIMREFLELTEQSQKLKIQFQHLQAGETLRNTSHSSTAADLLHSKQQILTYQQQLEERDHQLQCCQKESEELRTQITSLQDQIHAVQQERQKELESSYEQRLNEKDLATDSLKSALHNEEIKCAELQERISADEKSVAELREQLTQKSLEINRLSEELNTSKQRERRSSDEIKQLMGAVEDLQKKHHKDSQSEADLVSRREAETQRKLEQLQAELDEMYGQQIVQMKQELVKQHTLEIEKIHAQHKQELDNISAQTTINVTSERIDELNAVIGELHARLLQSDEEKMKMKEELAKKLDIVSSEKSHLQMQIEDLIHDLSFAREQIQKAKQSLNEKENKLNEANSFLSTIDDLKAQLNASKEFTKELESKHEAEVTNYKIKLEMLEREKDAVLDRMAESQEAELEKLRTYFLFSQEEELLKLRDEMTQDHNENVESLRDNLETKYKNQIDQMQHEMTQTISSMQLEKDNLITKQNNLILEISKLKVSTQSINDPKSEEMMIQINELQKELACLKREEKEKGSIEQEVQVLQLRIKELEKQVEGEEVLLEKLSVLETDNRLLKVENDALQNRTKGAENHKDLTDEANLDLKNQIEVLSTENQRLKNCELQLKEEIEKQKNTFSFAEKNFEVNYHELKNEYTFLAKEKEQLEDSKSKLEEEYRLRYEALKDELAELKGDKLGESMVGRSKLTTSDQLHVGEVIEKDTTELMEKLEIAQRDKEELSLKLTGLSEELQLKQSEINQLKEKVKSLTFERDHDHDHLEDESCMGHNEDIPRTVSSRTVVSNDGAGTRLLEESVYLIESRQLYGSPQVGELQKEVQEVFVEEESLLQKLHGLTGKLEAETSLVESTRLERDELQRKVDTVVQEQADLVLQLEAQRISLTQIHKAHLELMSENFRAEKEHDLRSLRGSLLAAEELRMQELRQQESLSRPPQTVTDGESCQDLTETLRQRISEECHHIDQVLGERLAILEVTTEEADNSRTLDQHRAAVQTLQAKLESLLQRFLEGYKQMSEISSWVRRTGDLQDTKVETEITPVTQIVINLQNSAPSQTGVQDAVISLAAASEETERLKSEFSQQRAQLEEEHTREIEHLRSYFQQKLKENEDRFSTEIIHLQEKFQDVSAGSLGDWELCRAAEAAAELGPEEAAIFQSVVAPSSDVIKNDEQMGDRSLRQPFGLISQQLQALRQALYSKYVEEVNALRRQHEAELDHLRAQLTEEHNKEKQEIIHRTKAKQEILNGSFQEPALYPIPEEKNPEDLNQLVEERFHEKIEEEVARVIVEMTIAFAQQTELSRLAALKDEEIAKHRESPEEQDEIPAQERQDVTLLGGPPDPVQTESSNTIPQSKDVTTEQHDRSQMADPLSKEKTKVLKEENYNQMVAMGAEGAKFRQLYEEKVEDMRQELVRQEQEYQQATEALRLAHAAQLERQMYDQEQLLLEVHRLRAQLAENASALTENQSTDREKMLLEELESMKQTCAESAGRTAARPVQDNSSQTQDERIPQPESEEPGWEYERGDGGERRTDEESRASDVIGDRKSLKRTNKHLLKILLEVVKTTGAVEETIGRHVVGLLDKSGRRQSTSKVHVWSAEPEDREVASPSSITVTVGPDGGDVGVGVEGAGIWSEAAGEELNVALQLPGEGFSRTDISPDDDAQILNISTRLQAAVEKLLEAITDTSNQLAHAKAAQTELVRESIKRKQETTELLRCQEELQERLNEEAKAREHLALELSKAEGLLDGYTDERVFLEKQMQEKSDLIRHLEQELQSTGNRLQELEQERQLIQEEKELLCRQKLALRADAAPAEQQLLEETEKLLMEKIEVQRQAEKDSGDLHKHVKVLEVELEEQVNRYTDLEQEKNADLEDLRHKNLALEKQLEKTRRFLDEQAVDREHERDVFQQEIQKLEEQLKMPQRHQPVTDNQSTQVEKLESNLKEKTDRCSELLLCKEQLQRDVQERNDEIEKLECRIRELEQALIISTDGLQKVERRPSVVIGLKGEMPLEAQLQVERDATDRKEKEITNLVEQLEQFREELENKNEEVQQLHMQLEIQRKEADTRLQELEQENKVLKDEVENTQHEHPETFSSKHLLPKPGKSEELLLLKDQEIDLLNEQIGKLQAQLEAATDNKVIEENNEKIKAYKSQIKCLKSDQEQLKKSNEEEIEKLNEVIEKLQEELSRIEQKVAVDFADKHQFEDTAAGNEMLQPLFGQGDAPFAIMEEVNVSASKPSTNNMAVSHESTNSYGRGNEISTIPLNKLSETLSEETQVTLQNMESKLEELMGIIKMKDEQIIMLEEQTLAMKDLKEKVKSLQLELEYKEMESFTHQLHPENLILSPNTEESNTDEAPRNKDMVRTKEPSENLMRKDINAPLYIERLTEELRAKTAQYLAVEALLVSVQEASKDAIHRLEIQVQDLQTSIQEKDAQLLKFRNHPSALLETEDIEQLNYVVRDLQQRVADGEKKTKEGQRETLIENSEVLLQRVDQDEDELARIKAELEKTRIEMTQLEKELEKHKLLQMPIENEESETSIGSPTVADQEQTLFQGARDPPEATPDIFRSTEETTTTIRNMELQIQKLQSVIHQKDAELLQYTNLEDLLDQQMKEIERLKNVQGDSSKEKKILIDSQVITKDLESKRNFRDPSSESEEEKNSDGGNVLKEEFEKNKVEIALLKEELKKIRDIRTKDGLSQTYHQDLVIENEDALQKVGEDDAKVYQLKAKLETTRMEMALMEEELSKLKLFQKSEDEKGDESRNSEGRQVMGLKPKLNKREAPSLEGSASIEETTANDMELHIEELQNLINLKDIELLQCENQKDLQAQEIAQLKKVINDLSKEEMNSGAARKDWESQISHKPKITENRDLQEECDDKSDLRGELEEKIMEMTALKEELEKLKEHKKHTERNIEEASKADLHEKDKKQLRMEKQVMVTSTEETTQKSTLVMESQLQEFQKLIEKKDSELKQLSEQKMEIEQLRVVIETLNQKLAEAELKISSKVKLESNVQHVRDEEKASRLLMNGDSTVTNSLVVKQDSRPLPSTEDSVDRQESLPGKSSGDETYDHGDVEEALLRDQTAQHLANQVLLTSIQETMQNTIDTMEDQLQEVQNVIKERDLEILLYIEEIEMLKEQVKAESDQHGQMMEAMEDTLREKVAAALVSDAQLKAIQVHTKQLHEDDGTDRLEQEARKMQALVSSKPSLEEETDSKLSALSMRLLELEKQLSDLHEQLQVEREQVNIANQQADEKERQLHDLRQVLENYTRNMDMKQTGGESIVMDSALSQGIVLKSEDNTVTDLENALQITKAEATATKEELCHYREMAEKLKEELMVKESNLAHLEEDLREVKKCLAHAEEKLAFYMKKELQEEEQQTMTVVDFTDGVRSPDWATKEKSTSSSSSSQTDKVPSVNNSNQTSRVHHKHIGVQKEMESAHLNNTSEEVAELMELYTDKISQMQELHAAEILDMESRHISEADTLRRDQYAVAQALTNECEALKAVIETLKSSDGVVPDSALSTPYHLTDAASSECDWSQGTYDAHSPDHLPEGLRVEDEVPEVLLPTKIKDLLRAIHQEGMQVLSLTEATSPEKEKSFTISTQSWREERKTLIETIASLKDLIAKMQIYKDPEVHVRTDFHDRCPDWRGELLRAIQEVFCREQDAFLSAFHTQLSSLGSCDATALVSQMQHHLQEQGMEQINAMDCIQNAERRSLLLEIQDLRAKLTNLQINPGIESLHHTEGAARYLPQDQSSIPQEMHLQLNSMSAKASELHDQLGSERLLSAEIKNELALTKMELESTLKLQHKHFKELESLRMELKKRREELDSINDALMDEQKRSRELQWALEKEKTKSERSERQEREELEDSQILLEEQKTKTRDLSKQLAEEQLLVKSLQEQLATKESLYEAALSQERSKVSELQAFLVAERTRSGELAIGLECKQGIEARVRSNEGSGESEDHHPAEELLRDLQAQLDTKHHRILELVTEAEGYKLESVQLRQNLDEERQRLQKEVEAEREAAKLSTKRTEELRTEVEELQRQVQDKVTEIRRLRAEERHLKDTIQSLHSSDRTKENVPERTELPESSGAINLSTDRARSELHQPEGSVPNVLCPDPLSATNGDPGANGTEFNIDTIRRKLQQVSLKLRHLAAKATRRATFDTSDDTDFAWSQNAIKEVMCQLEQVSTLSLQGQCLVLPPGMSGNTLTEKLLTQNAELTGYVSRLTNEKNDLQNALLRLEGEVAHHRARDGSGDHSYPASWDLTMNVNSFTEEREAWNKEKLNLHKSLKQMEAELSKVKAELRTETMQRDIGRDTDNAALKRVYGKYLRSESFRKALVYQKKYLLLLLGGFQECEEATLVLIARMGGQPSCTDLEVITKHSRAFTRFRSAARVAIAISRMKFLVRRWQRTISPATGTANRNGFGQLIGNEGRTDSPYHPAGSMDLYGDQRLSSCRSRSGFDSPQSTVNSQHRYASSGPSPCSHLQNYDPDRALTDYIARLEALQKRLGSVPSGPSTISTTHYSIRR